jgi:hypothetical protein
MPTSKQIYEMQEAQNILGLSDEQFYCNDFSREPLNERNYSSRDSVLNEINSKTIGYSIKKGNDFKYFKPKSRGKK